MKYTSEAFEPGKIEAVGGKGAHLQKLISWGAPVPPFFVLTTEAFKYFRDHQALPHEVEERFVEFFKEHPFIALRSSMISEDNADSSFAGLFETLLDVNKENWKTSLIKIYASVTSDRVKEYIARKKLVVELEMAVVAQELIPVEKSGVLFTRSPVEPTGAIAIDAAFGMGEGVVSGLTEVDHYQLTRTMDLIQVRSNHSKEVLCVIERQELVEIALQLEKQLGAPCDIEWGYKGGKLYIFQIRPITRSFKPLTYFVDTNLSESYPGTVSPFTASFVQKAYENVFKESAIIMGAHGQGLRKLEFHYKKLISCVDDHLYYNLEHYYAVLRALPGGEKNIENWHQMIGGKIVGHSIPYHSTELNSLEMVTTVGSLLKLSFTRNKTFKLLLKDLEQIKADIELDIKNLRGSKATILYLNHLLNRPLGFGLTVVNDIFIMIGLGLLTRSLRKKGLKEEQVIDLLKTSEGIDSVKPLEHFNDLVGELDEKFIQAFANEKLEVGLNPFEVCFKNLQGQGWGEEVKKLRHFLQAYGDRSFEELKLESLPMKNNPTLMKDLLQWAKANPSISKNLSPCSAKIDLNLAERKLVKFTRESIAYREATRLWRGKFYHLLRQLVLNVGESLKLEDASWRSFSLLDFFSVNHHEWKRFALNEVKKEDIQDLMIKRRPWQTKKRHYPEIIPWVESELLPELNVSIATGSLEGQGVSPGVTEGVALVLENPNEALSSNLKNFILVTKNTDPAWVYIMSRSLGLISEKGSLLSHTAIIGRELNIPTIVGVKMATQKIKSGDRLRIDATKGTIAIL